MKSTPQMFQPFKTSVWNRLLYLADWAKNFELRRREAAASMQRTKKEKEKYLNASTAFAYKVIVEDAEDGLDIRLERIPSSEYDPSLNDITIEAQRMFDSLLPSEIEYSLNEMDLNMDEYLKPFLEEYIQEQLAGGVS